MSHSNSTTNYSLPQFINTDKPAWLTDINGAFADIDTSLKTASDAANTADGKAVTAQTTADNAVNSINALINKYRTISKTVVVNGITTTIHKAGEYLTISASSGSFTEAVAAYATIIDISNYSEFDGISFAVDGDYLDTYDHSTRIIVVKNSTTLAPRANLPQDHPLRYTITLPINIA